ncbi:MAG: hypothetical protein ABJC09_13135 [Terriglobia bacterium]
MTLHPVSESGQIDRCTPLGAAEQQPVFLSCTFKLLNRLLVRRDDILMEV